MRFFGLLTITPGAITQPRCHLEVKNSMIPPLKSLTMPLVATAVAAILSSGCSPKEAKAQDSRQGKPPAGASKAWNWDQHPLVHTMKIGTLSCQVQPKSVIAVQAPLAGTLRVYATAPQTNLPVNFLRNRCAAPPNQHPKQ